MHSKHSSVREKLPCDKLSKRDEMKSEDKSWSKNVPNRLLKMNKNDLKKRPKLPKPNVVRSSNRQKSKRSLKKARLLLSKEDLNSSISVSSRKSKLLSKLPKNRSSWKKLRFRMKP